MVCIRKICTLFTWFSGTETLTVFSDSSLEVIWSERRLEPLLERESIGGRRLVAPRPASRLLSNDGDRAHMNAWKDETVNTPSLFNVPLVARDTCVSKLCKVTVKVKTQERTTL